MIRGIKGLPKCRYSKSGHPRCPNPKRSSLCDLYAWATLQSLLTPNALHYLSIEQIVSLLEDQQEAFVGQIIVFYFSGTGNIIACLTIIVCTELKYKELWANTMATSSGTCSLGRNFYSKQTEQFEVPSVFVILSYFYTVCCSKHFMVSWLGGHSVCQMFVVIWKLKNWPELLRASLM